MKRGLDIAVSFFGLVFLSPVLLTVILLVWIRDWHNPLYMPCRAGIGGRVFRMVKLRTMVVNADHMGGSSTAANDRRITSVGRFIRRYKLDEFAQLCNVLVGHMSLVGPRPNLKEETERYTAEEKKLLKEKPGITDFSSIVFSDEGEILRGRADPDRAYDELIRPWKSRLGIFYVEHQAFVVDLQLICYTLLAIVNRPAALVRVQRLLARMGASEELVRIAGRSEPLTPHYPPGMTELAPPARSKPLGMSSAFPAQAREVLTVPEAQGIVAAAVHGPGGSA